MKQPVKKLINNKIKKKKSHKIKTQEQLDGSGLETFFRINILDKLGIEYDQQFKAKSIGRFYDFHLKYNNGLSMKVLIEVDGDYYHKNPAIYEKAINAIQKKNMRVDKYKNVWALANGYTLIRIWETDIRKNPTQVMDLLTKKLKLQTKVVLLSESKKNGTFFIKKNIN